jgi:hypothetical protein
VNSFALVQGNGKGGCEAKLQVEYGDLYRTNHYDYGGGHDIYTTFICPECGVETDIDYNGPNSRDIPDKKDHSLYSVEEGKIIYNK